VSIRAVFWQSSTSQSAPHLYCLAVFGAPDVERGELRRHHDRSQHLSGNAEGEQDRPLHVFLANPRSLTPAGKGGVMAKLARDVMTPDPVCCPPDATIDEVARLMTANNCGEIPVVDSLERPIGVITDRDIVCRVVAENKNPMAHTVDSCMTSSVVTVRADASIDEVIAIMEDHQIRRVPVVDDDGCCAGIISQADIAALEPPNTTAELLWEVSRDTGSPSR
jgi:CBS domain-containing protein